MIRYALFLSLITGCGLHDQYHPADMMGTPTPPDMATVFHPDCVKDTDCTNGGVAPCGGKCSAQGSCTYPGGETDCGSTCSGTTEHAKVCDNKGSCVASTFDCGAYQCGATTCKTSCMMASVDCTNGTPCIMNKCTSCPGDMVYIPPGSFTMGFASAGHDQQVTALLSKGYCIDKTEVTNASYKACVTAGACTAPDTTKEPTNCSYALANSDNLPANCVTWDQAKAYCGWTGLGGGARRLPTEAEWERAARSTDARPYPWGTTPEYNCFYANYAGQNNPNFFECNNNSPHIVAVGTTPMGNSPDGLFDMVGNVEEWTSDCFVLDYTNGAICSPNSTCTDPLGSMNCVMSNNQPEHSIRGGFYGTRADSAQSYVRNGAVGQGSNIGFRCAK